jgi:hypothetical protein
LIVAEGLRSLIENYFLKSSRENSAERSALNIGIDEYLSDAHST